MPKSLRTPLASAAFTFLAFLGGLPSLSTALAGDSTARPPASKIDFAYAFAPPHRLTVGRPDDSHRTLLDLQPGSLRLAWTYDNLTGYPLGSFMTPHVNWAIRVTPRIDGQPLSQSRWTRLGGYLPALENVYLDPRGSVRLEVIGAREAALVRIEINNTDGRPHQFVVACDSANWGENRAWVDPSHWTGDYLLAGWLDRADRVLVAGLGAEQYSLASDGRPPGPRSMLLVWNIPPGEKRSGWLVRPYGAYLSDLDALRKTDWAGQFTEAGGEWQALLAGASRLTIPDRGVATAFLACLADLFIMREPVAGGYVAGVPGTEVYRAANSFEASIMAVALDQVGLHDQSAEGHRVCLDMQGSDGEWDDPQGWGHLMWGGAGFKAWAAMEHYRMTRDLGYLTDVYPRMAASARWRERQRARTREATDAGRPLVYGLMPRGVGDCGLADGDDNYGVFLPHNIWALYADELAVEAARILGRTDDLAELRAIYETARADLLAALERGSIQEKDYRWIPGVPGKTSGSRWGVLNALYPCGLLPPNHDLITGTLQRIESHMSPGGIPLHTGWMEDGMWVAIALDNVAEAHLARGEGDAAAAYLYATLNHGTPLITWCEERGQEPGTTKCSGDRQHLWTPVAVVRELRDAFVMEQADGLHLALGTHRDWLGGGKPIGVTGAPTHFGRLTYEMKYEQARKAVSGEVRLEEDARPPSLVLHVRLPGGRRVVAVDSTGQAIIMAGGEAILWRAPKGVLKFRAKIC